MKSPKSWKSIGYICLKTTFLHLKHQQIYLTLLSTTCVKIHQIPYVIFKTICHSSRHNYIILAQTLHTFDKNIPSECKFSDFSLHKLKFMKFVSSFFKQKVSYSLNFGSLFSVMEITFLYFFSWNWFWKGAHQSAKFQTFDRSRNISPNLYFDRFLKVYKILAKKYRGVISHDPADLWKTWRKTDLLIQKWQEFGEIWPGALATLQNLHFHLLLLCKVFNVWPKKV